MDIAAGQATNPDQLRDAALCRSVLYGALSLGFHYPTEENLAWLRSEDARLALWDAASFLMSSAGGEENSRQASGNLVARVEDWVTTFDSLSLEESLARYGKLFGHTARGPVCPYEARSEERRVGKECRL